MCFNKIFVGFYQSYECYGYVQSHGPFKTGFKFNAVEYNSSEFNKTDKYL